MVGLVMTACSYALTICRYLAAMDKNVYVSKTMTFTTNGSGLKEVKEVDRKRFLALSDSMLIATLSLLC